MGVKLSTNGARIRVFCSSAHITPFNRVCLATPDTHYMFVRCRWSIQFHQPGVNASVTKLDPDDPALIDAAECRWPASNGRRTDFPTFRLIFIPSFAIPSVINQPLERAENILRARQAWAELEFEASKGTLHVNNGDRSGEASFHKTLPHNEFGEVRTIVSRDTTHTYNTRETFRRTLYKLRGQSNVLCMHAKKMCNVTSQQMLRQAS